MLKIKVILGDDALELEGDFTSAETLALIREFFTLSTRSTQHAIDSLTTRLVHSNARLHQSISTHQP